MANAGSDAAANPNPAQESLIEWLFGDVAFGQAAINGELVHYN